VLSPGRSVSDINRVVDVGNGQCKVTDMQRMRIPVGSQVFLRAPAQPMVPEIVAAISRLVVGAPEINEAHLPQVFVSGAMQAPTQVLVIVTVDKNMQQALEPQSE
jgi:hypothetical protein